MDRWVRVDYTPGYIASVREALGWNTDYHHDGSKGNLVYQFMIDICRTKYLVHFDIDLVMWAHPGYSWVQHGVALFRENPKAFFLTLPLVGSMPLLGNSTT